jgi:hypothetical protein
MTQIRSRHGISIATNSAEYISPGSVLRTGPTMHVCEQLPHTPFTLLKGLAWTKRLYSRHAHVSCRASTIKRRIWKRTICYVADVGLSPNYHLYIKDNCELYIHNLSDCYLRWVINWCMQFCPYHLRTFWYRFPMEIRAFLLDCIDNRPVHF